MTGCLGPVNVVAAIAGEIGAMPPVPRLHKVDVRIGEEFAARVGVEADEWIVLRGEDECGTAMRSTTRALAAL